jgi:hypothetical protein
MHSLNPQQSKGRPNFINRCADGAKLL